MAICAVDVNMAICAICDVSMPINAICDVNMAMDPLPQGQDL